MSGRKIQTRLENLESTHTKQATIRRFRRDDEDEAIGLLLSKLSPQERSEVYQLRKTRWHWQYYENPANPETEPILWVAEEETKEDEKTKSRIVGLVCPLAVKVRTPLGLTLGSWCNDWIVHSDYRGKGLGWQLEDAWVKTFPIALGRGWSKRAYEVSVKLGLITVSGFLRCWIVLSRFGFASLLWRVRHFERLKRLLLLPVGLTLSKKRQLGVELGVSSSLLGDEEGIWIRVASCYGFAVERDQAYLEWRYSKNPMQEFKYIRATSNGKLLGLAIVRLSSDRPPIGVICDLVLDPNDIQVGVGLLEKAIEFFSSKGACAVTLDLPPALEPVIRAIKRPIMIEEAKILVGDNDGKYGDLGIYDAKSWYLSRSDSDIDFSPSAL